MENQFSSELSKLQDHPFSPTAGANRPYLSSAFREALASLYYGLEYGTRILLLSAERGIGKTTLLRYWERRIQQRGRTLFVSSNADSAKLLRKLIAEIGGDATGDLNAMRLHADGILRTLASPGNPFILLLDLNENSAGSALEIINHLSKLESFRTGAFRIVIAVPDVVAEELQRSEFARDIQRVPLAPLTATEVEGYIEYRLRMAGWRGGPLFTPASYASIARSSSAKPSNINEICFDLLQKLSESANGRSDRQDHGQEIPLNEQFVNSVISGQKSAGTQLPNNAVDQNNVVDQVASPEALRNRRAATIASIVLILVIAIAGLWYEIANKANTTKRVGTSTIPTPTMAHHAIARDGSVARPLPIPDKRTATGVAVKAASASGLAVPMTDAPRVLSPSSRTVPLKDAGYSVEQIDKKGPKFSGAAVSRTSSANGIATLSSAPTQTPQPHPEQPATSKEQAAAVKQRAEEIADREIGLGDAYMKAGEYDKAILSFSRALASAPDDEEAHEKMRRARRAKTAEENVLQ